VGIVLTGLKALNGYEATLTVVLTVLVFVLGLWLMADSLQSLGSRGSGSGDGAYGGHRRRRLVGTGAGRRLSVAELLRRNFDGVTHVLVLWNALATSSWSTPRARFRR
jgi:hypothetical protein